MSRDIEQADPSFRELASLLARGYLRLLTASRMEPAQESPTGPRIGVDVAGRPKHELDRGVRP
jgi:hypothetical protein